MYEPETLDARSLAYHRLVATKLRANPALLERAKETLARWREKSSVRSQPLLQTWEEILAKGVDAAVAISLEDSERAAELRSSSPLSVLLSNQERFAFIRQWRSMHGTR
jgi:hypothetical protein